MLDDHFASYALCPHCNEQGEKENVALFVVLFMLLVSLQLAACSELRPIYTIQDSGKRGVGVSGWLDNDRVVFYSEQRAEAKAGDGPEGPPIVDAGYYFGIQKAAP